MHSGEIFNIKIPGSFALARRVMEKIKTSIAPGTGKWPKNNESIEYILNTTEKNSTVIDIGGHKHSYIFDMLSIAGNTKNLIVFEDCTEHFKYFSRIKNLLLLKNVVIEDCTLFSELQQARVIAIDDRIGYDPLRSTALSTSLTDYFLINGFKPDLFNIRAGLNILTMLMKMKPVLKTYKPKILIECCEGACSREKLLVTFAWLNNFGYFGTFILGNMKIPLTSFDFDLYLNEYTGFYCNYFVFE